MTPQEKIKRLTELHKVSVAEFAQKCGYSRPQAFYDLLSGKTKKISARMAERIMAAFPDVDPAWLISPERIFVNTTSEVLMKSESTDFLVPLLPLEAMGGDLNDFTMSIKPSDCEQIISPIKSVDFAMTVTGDSMYPEYPNGSRILIKKIDETAFIEWGKVYVLDTCNGTIIKEVRKGSNERSVWCHSVNPDPKYQPFSVNFTDIYGIYRVVLCMSVK